MVSVKGHFPDSTDPGIEHYLVEGPMTRFAVDLNDLLRVMAGEEKAKKLRLTEPVQLNQIHVHYALGFEGLNGLVHTPVDQSIRNSICRAATHLKTLGLAVTPCKLPNLSNSVEMALSGIAGQDGMVYLLEAGSGESGKVRQTLWEILRSLVGQSSYTTNALMFELLRRTNAFMTRAKVNQYLEESRRRIGEFSVSEQLVNMLVVAACAGEGNYINSLNLIICLIIIIIRLNFGFVAIFHFLKIMRSLYHYNKYCRHIVDISLY